jgi:uncharacterized protein (TIGR02453 family)
MLSSATLQFLYDLSQNNNRDWFEKNKARYEKDVKKPLEATVGAILDRIREFEPDWRLEPKECLFRQHRDTRFSADKSPYKTNLAAVFNPGGRKNLGYPGYYFHLEYGQLMLGGGAYFLDKPALEKVRRAIARDPEGFRALVMEPGFRDKFGDLRGETNKILPPEFREAARTEPLLFNKQFYFMAELDPETAIRPGFPETAAAYFRAAKPVNDFLVRALGSEF